jgi:hypothetical protein
MTVAASRLTLNASLRDATSGSDPNVAPLLISRVYEEELTR